MTTFETGKKYEMFSVCDSNCKWEYTVVKRTAKTVTLDNGNETINCRIKSDKYDGEFVKPLGNYSMAPILKSKREVK